MAGCSCTRREVLDPWLSPAWLVVVGWIVEKEKGKSKSLNGNNRPRSDDVMVYMMDTTLGQTKGSMLSARGSESPNEIKVGCSPFCFRGCSRVGGWQAQLGSGAGQQISAFIPDRHFQRLRLHVSADASLYSLLSHQCAWPSSSFHRDLEGLPDWKL